MRLIRFSPVAEYAGKTRIPLPTTCTKTDRHSEVACYMASVIEGIPASTSRMDEIRAKTSTDTEVQSGMKLIKTFNPGTHGCKSICRSENRAARTQWTCPQRQQDCGAADNEEILQKIHEGQVKCRERACSSMWWPGLSADINRLVASCRYDHAWLFLLLWFPSPRWGWALGRVWIAPADTDTPASHLPSSGHGYRSWRSNQSSPDNRTILRGIRPTPEFPSLQVFSQVLTLFFPSARLPCPSSVSWFPHACVAVHG